MTLRSFPFTRRAPSKENAMGRRIDVTVTYLEQTRRPLAPLPPCPPGKIALIRSEATPTHFYRYLYSLVGDPWGWVSRKRLSDTELRIILDDDRVHVYVLYVDGSPAGFAELDLRARDDAGAEIRFFGLAPERIRTGLGRFFFAQIVALAWSMDARCLRLETCTLDHPSALKFYQKAGFSVYDQRRGIVELTDEEAGKLFHAR